MSISKLPTDASLTQVMDSFEYISNIEGLAIIDITVKTELPNEVKNGQLCIISNNKPSKIIIDYADNISKYTLNENDIFIQYAKNLKNATNFKINSFVNINCYIDNIFIAKNGKLVRSVENYLGVDNEWLGIFNITRLDIIKDGAFVNNFSIENYSNASESNISYSDGAIFFRSASYDGISYHTNKTINVDNFTKLVVEITQSVSFQNKISLTDKQTNFVRVCSFSVSANTKHTFNVSNVDTDVYIEVLSVNKDLNWPGTLGIKNMYFEL